MREKEAWQLGASHFQRVLGASHFQRVVDCIDEIPEAYDLLDEDA